MTHTTPKKIHLTQLLPWKLLQLQLCLHLDSRASLQLTPTSTACPQNISISCPLSPILFTQNLLFTVKICKSIGLVLVQALLSTTHLTNLLFFLKLMGNVFFTGPFFKMLFALSWSFIYCKDLIFMLSIVWNFLGYAS